MKKKTAIHPSFQELMTLSMSDLKKEAMRGQKSLFLFRLQKKKGDPVSPHEIRNKRKHFARVKTAINLKMYHQVGGE